MAKYLRTKVAEQGLTKLIQRLGRDCLPTQFVREFVMNGIEAIQRTGQPGQILIDVNWDIHKEKNLYKMSFWDTGDGMYLEDMIDHLNNLSSTGNENIYENYGMGAKIAALTRNHAGIMYESWKGDDGSRIIIGFNDEEEVYGVMPIEDDLGGVEWGVHLILDEKPDFIKESGTIVTLFGRAYSDDTMMPPAGAKGGRENWLHYYINSRFFVIPSDITLKVRTGYYRDPENKRHNYLRVVSGQKNTLNGNSSYQGVVETESASIFWWILNEDAAGHGRENLRGHTGCINQDEIFDVADGRSNRAPNFGIIVGKEDIVIYVKPKCEVVQDTTRTRLLMPDGTALPWDEWQDQFRANFPSEIKEFMQAKLAKSGKDAHADSIKGRLNEVRHLYNLSRYRADKKGEHFSDPESETRVHSGLGETETEYQGSKRISERGPGAGTVSEFLRTRIVQHGEQSRRVHPDNTPDTCWVSVQDGSRNPEEIKDRAAEYLERDNLIKINGDFQGFQDLYGYYLERYDGIDAVGAIIWDRIKEVFEQQLIEAVLGAQLLKNRPEWTPEDFQASVSSEALTSVVMMRYHVVKFLDASFKRELPKLALMPDESIVTDEIVQEGNGQTVDL